MLASATLTGVRTPGGPIQSTPAPASRAVSSEPRSSWQTGATSALRRPSREHAMATLQAPPGSDLGARRVRELAVHRQRLEAVEDDVDAGRADAGHVMGRSGAQRATSVARSSRMTVTRI